MSILDNLVTALLPITPSFIVYSIAKRYIAGKTMDDMVKVVKDLNKQGMLATCDLLGEEVKNKEQSRKAVEEYKKILKRIEEEGLNATISIKPTQFGLNLDYDFCFANISEIIEEVIKYESFVRLDIEDKTVVSDTFKLYKELKEKYPEKYFGTAVQSYLRRNIDDMNILCEDKPNLRICKGAYREKREIVWQDMEIINKSFSWSIEKIFQSGGFAAVATHDEKVIWDTLRLLDKYKIRDGQYEFQMLLGVDKKLQDILLAEGHQLRIYIPYGRDWRPYLIRRLQENPKLVTYVLKNMFTRY
jgi:proline dehydrogenase